MKQATGPPKHDTRVSEYLIYFILDFMGKSLQQNRPEAVGEPDLSYGE